MKYADFEKKANEVVKQLGNRVEALPWEDKAFYCNWLVQTHTFVDHTSRFLQLCRNKMTDKKDLVKEYDHHIEEEFGHEQLCINDMKFMEIPMNQRNVFIETKMFFKSQYYWIHEVGPTAHLGYSLLLEGLAAVSGPRIMDRVLKAGWKGHTFLKVHAEADDGHFGDALKIVETLTDAERDHVWTNLNEGLEQYMMILDRCASRGVYAAKAS